MDGARDSCLSSDELMTSESIRIVPDWFHENCEERGGHTVPGGCNVNTLCTSFYVESTSGNVQSCMRGKKYPEVSCRIRECSLPPSQHNVSNDKHLLQTMTLHEMNDAHSHICVSSPQGSKPWRILGWLIQAWLVGLFTQNLNVSREEMQASLILLSP